MSWHLSSRILFVFFALLAFVSCGRNGQLFFGPDHQKLFCQTDQDCGLLEICTQVYGCQLRTPRCQTDSECREGSTCSNGVCLEPGVCYFNYQCPREKICDQYRCVYQRCDEDSECAPGQRCDVVDGSCREGLCFDDSECSSDECCDPLSSRCVPSDICERYENGVPADCQPQPEQCDHLDNDCDGALDEDFPELGASCSAGTGVCLRLGHIVCAQDDSGAVCDAVPGPSEAEVCDGVDNDCDGVMDEGC